MSWDKFTQSQWDSFTQSQWDALAQDAGVSSGEISQSYYLILGIL